MPTKEKKKEYEAKFRKSFKEKHGCSYGTFYCRKLREKVFNLLGKKCVYCGCDVQELLEINHKELGTNRTKKRTESGSTAYYLKILNGEIPLEELETACKVCNILHYCRKKFGDIRHKVIWEIR